MLTLTNYGRIKRIGHRIDWTKEAQKKFKERNTDFRESKGVERVGSFWSMI